MGDVVVDCGSTLADAGWWGIVAVFVVAAFLVAVGLLAAEVAGWVRETWTLRQENLARIRPRHRVEVDPGVQARWYDQPTDQMSLTAAITIHGATKVVSIGEAVTHRLKVGAVRSKLWLSRGRGMSRPPDGVPQVPVATPGVRVRSAEAAAAEARRLMSCETVTDLDMYAMGQGVVLDSPTEVLPRR